MPPISSETTISKSLPPVKGPYHNVNGCNFLLTVGSFLLNSGAFLLPTTLDNFSFFTYNWSFFAYNFSFFLLTIGAFLLTMGNVFTHSWSFLAYNGKVRLIRALRDCKPRSSTVSKQAPTVSKKASPNANPSPPG